MSAINLCPSELPYIHWSLLMMVHSFLLSLNCLHKTDNQESSYEFAAFIEIGLKVSNNEQTLFVDCFKELECPCCMLLWQYQSLLEHASLSLFFWAVALRSIIDRFELGSAYTYHPRLCTTERHRKERKRWAHLLQFPIVYTVIEKGWASIGSTSSSAERSVCFSVSPSKSPHPRNLRR